MVDYTIAMPLVPEILKEMLYEANPKNRNVYLM